MILIIICILLIYDVNLEDQKCNRLDIVVKKIESHIEFRSVVYTMKLDILEEHTKHQLTSSNSFILIDLF